MGDSVEDSLFKKDNLNFTLASFGSKIPPEVSSPVKLNFTLSRAKDLERRVCSTFQDSLPSLAASTLTAKNPSSEPLSSLVLTAGDMIGDLTSHVRSSFDGANKIFGTESPSSLGALGFTNAFSVIKGGLDVQAGVNETKKAQKISDVAGQALGCLKVAKGGSFAIGGALLLPFRALSIAALYTASKIVTTLAGVFGSVGGAFFSIGTLFVTVATGIRLHEQRVFRQGLQAILNGKEGTVAERNAKALDYLRKQATVSSEEKEKVLEALKKDPAFAALNPAQQKEKIDENESALLKKKEALFKRVVGNEPLERIRASGPAQAAEILASVQKATFKKTVLSSIAMALLILGIAVSIAALVCTGPIGIVVTTLIGLTLSLGWLVLDGYELFDEFKGAKPGRFYKMWIFIY
jgi:hypothetical protein